MWCAIRFNFGSTALFKLYQRHVAVMDSELLLYTDYTYLVIQHKDIKTNEEHLNRHFLTLADWFVDNNRSSHRRCIKKGVLKSITKFTGKLLCQSLFLIKLQAQAYNFIKKKTLAQVLFCEFCETLKNTFLQNTSGRLLL